MNLRRIVVGQLRFRLRLHLLISNHDALCVLYFESMELGNLRSNFGGKCLALQVQLISILVRYFLVL
jgi:hypothetical protein